MKRRTAREKAIQALFQLDLNEQEPSLAIEHVLEGKESDEFLEQLVLGTTENKQEIDNILIKNLENWSLDRIGNVDRAILRLAVYEMKYEESIPQNVSINEAIELAKIFGDDESSKFINSVLSKVLDK
ncbi:transcription antitermination factor NusB [Bacillus sp. BGMRC 2118]|nr:transcription antitermination factor NusB [Bacillus sp. BGMRC 2118]